MRSTAIQVTDPAYPSVFTVREAKAVNKAMTLIEKKTAIEQANSQLLH